MQRGDSSEPLLPRTVPQLVPDVEAVDDPIEKSKIIANCNGGVFFIFSPLKAGDEGGLTHFALPDEAYLDEFVDVFGALLVRDHLHQGVVHNGFGFIEGQLANGAQEHDGGAVLAKAVAAGENCWLTHVHVEAQIASRAIHFSIC
jgi:hypothetical protein